MSGAYTSSDEIIRYRQSTPQLLRRRVFHLRKAASLYASINPAALASSVGKTDYYYYYSLVAWVHHPGSLGLPLLCWCCRCCCCPPGLDATTIQYSTTCYHLSSPFTL